MMTPSFTARLLGVEPGQVCAQAIDTVRSRMIAGSLENRISVNEEQQSGARALPVLEPAEVHFLEKQTRDLH
jgi:hypothetical protein